MTTVRMSKVPRDVLATLEHQGCCIIRADKEESLPLGHQLELEAADNKQQVSATIGSVQRAADCLWYVLSNGNLRVEVSSAEPHIYEASTSYMFDAFDYMGACVICINHHDDKQLIHGQRVILAEPSREGIVICRQQEGETWLYVILNIRHPSCSEVEHL